MDKLTTDNNSLSVVIPSYNSENSIEILLNSLIKELNDIFIDYEIIIVNDILQSNC